MLSCRGRNEECKPNDGFSVFVDDHLWEAKRVVKLNSLTLIRQAVFTQCWGSTALEHP